MFSKMICLVSMIALLATATVIQAELFSLGAVEDIELGNDAQLGPDATRPRVASRLSPVNSSGSR